MNNTSLIKKCPICHSEKLFSTGIFIESNEIIYCNLCQHQFNNCSLDDFNNSIQKFEHHSGTAPKTKDLQRRTKRLNKIFKEFIPKSIKNGRYLDIGCSDGFTLGVAKEYGLNAYGVETAKKPGNIAKQNGFDVHIGSLESAKFNDNSFDVISLFEVIEHIPNPNPILKEIFRILDSNGILIISTGNARSISARVLKANWDYYDLFGHGGHINFYCKNSIELLCNDHNLKIKKILTRRISLTSCPNSGRITDYFLKILSEILSFPIKKIGLGHDMIVSFSSQKNSL